MRSALNPNTFLQLSAGFLLLGFIFSPAMVRFLEKEGYENLAIVLSWIGYVWMAFIALFFFFGIITDLVRFLSFIAKKVGIFDFSLILKGSLKVNLSKAHFFLPFLLSALFVIYGFIEASQIRIEKVTVTSDKISRDVKIVQISDVHVGLLIRERKLEKIANEVKKLSPDILVSTGDLVDGQIDHLDGLSDILKNIDTKFGKYAITGNHEFYRGIEQSLSFIEKSGFIVLRNEGIYIEELNLNILGVDDPEALRFGEIPKISESELLRKFQNRGFVLLLKHRPIIDKNSLGLFDLQLSGHTHKGQFFPFSLITALYYEKHAGCLSKINGCYLYTSRGTGTWGPPIRIFAPPEITSIELKRELKDS